MKTERQVCSFMKKTSSASKNKGAYFPGKKKDDGRIHRFAALLRNPGKAGGLTNLLMITRMSFALFIGVILLLAITLVSSASNNIPVRDPKYDSITVSYLKDFNIRGTVYDRNGVAVAESVPTADGKYVRQYRYIESIAHLIGSSYGRRAVESYYSTDLVGYRRDNIKQGRGDDVHLTVDVEMQNRIYTLLGDIDVGGVVVSDAKTGAVLTMISLPSYDFTLSGEEAKQIYSSGEYVNNCMAGLTPGSVGKLMTACILSENGYNPAITDNGSVEFGENIAPVRNYEGVTYEEIQMQDAIKESSNVWFSTAAWQFCNLSGRFSVTDYVKGMEKLGMNNTVSTQLGDIYQSHKITSADPNELVQSSFGQGQLLVSPLYMNILTSAIVTDGTMRTPWFVSKTVSPKGKLISQTVPQDLPFSITPEACQPVKEGMLKAGEEEYGFVFNGMTGEVYAKTGTAEITEYRNNKFITCSFPKEDPQYTFTVFDIEGLGMSYDLKPIAQDIINIITEYMVLTETPE